MKVSFPESQGLIPEEPIAQYEIGDYKNFIYLLLDWDTKKAAIVDPQRDLSGPLGALKTHGFKLEAILLTHTHFDHTAGVGPLLAEFPELKLYVGARDLHRLPKATLARPGLQVISKETNFRIGGMEVLSILTPGHSAGAVSYFIQKGPGIRTPYLFTGDTIFIRDCGRTDLETGSNEEMFDSIQRIKTLPAETIFLVGHHYTDAFATKLEDELRFSPPFQCKSVKELASLP